MKGKFFHALVNPRIPLSDRQESEFLPAFHLQDMYMLCYIVCSLCIFPTDRSPKMKQNITMPVTDEYHKDNKDTSTKI